MRSAAPDQIPIARDACTRVPGLSDFVVPFIKHVASNIVKAAEKTMWETQIINAFPNNAEWGSNVDPAFGFTAKVDFDQANPDLFSIGFYVDKSCTQRLVLQVTTGKQADTCGRAQLVSRAADSVLHVRSACLASERGGIARVRAHCWLSRMPVRSCRLAAWTS